MGTTKKLTFKEFRATGVHCADIGEKLGDECLQGVAGRIYLDCLYIERWNDPRGPWLTTIANTQPHGELKVVERVLYDFAKAEGYCDPVEGK